MKHAIIAAIAFAAASPVAAQNLILHGGTIHTGVDGAPPAEMVIDRDGRIAYAYAAMNPEGHVTNTLKAVEEIAARRGGAKR